MRTIVEGKSCEERVVIRVRRRERDHGLTQPTAADRDMRGCPPRSLCAS